MSTGYFSELLLKQAFPASRRKRVTSASGSFMFADISGFTEISDRLSGAGRLGSEELAAVVNAVFDPILGIVRSFRGDVVKFGGDAVLVHFKGPDHSRRAIECGRMMLVDIEDSGVAKTSLGEFPLSIHIGISKGKAVSAIVGSRESHYDHLLCGPDISASYIAADKADSGRMCVTGDCFTCSGIEKAEYTDGFYIVPTDGEKAARRPNRLPEKRRPHRSDTDRFLTPGIRRKIAESKRGRVEGEHRPVTTVFVGIQGWHDNLALRENGLHPHYQKVNRHIASLFRIVEKYGGNVIRLDVTSVGERALIIFGAPVLRENAPADALAAALEIDTVTNEISRSLPAPISVRMGINSGLCYAGDVGGSYRREYTVIGKEVNLAARLMSAADSGEIVVGQGTVEAAGGKFLFSEKGACRLKGIADQVRIFKLEGLVSKGRINPEMTTLIGRQKETGILREFVDNLEDGRGGTLQIFGEAGSGKTSLIEFGLAEMKRRGLPALRSSCPEHMSNVPLFPIGEILKDALGVADGDDKDTRRSKLISGLEKTGDAEWEPLICRLVGYAAKPTREITNLAEDVKRERIFQLAGSAISGYFPKNRGCIVIDDYHWSDSTTIGFMDYHIANLVRNGIGVVLISRISDQVPRYERSVIIDLGQLDDISSARLFGTIAGQEIPESMVQEIVKTSGGNPFYLEEMAKAVRDMGIETWQHKREIPDSVERVITARIDRLDEMVRGTIRTASVIGRIFGVDELSGIFPIEEEIPRIPEYLDKSAALDITPVEKTIPVLQYRFKHILTRDVAYAGLTYKSRKSIHLALARYYRANRRTTNIEPQLIGYHLENSDDPLSAIPYYLMAGRIAAREFANEEAVSDFSKVIGMAAERAHVNIVCRCHLEMGKVFKLTGKYEKSEYHLRKAVELSPKEKRWRREALISLSELYRIQSDFQRAEAVLSELLAIDPRSPGLRAVYENGLGDIARRKGDAGTALEHFAKAIFSENDIDPGLAAKVYNNSGICSWTQGRLDEAVERYNRAMYIYKKERDLQGTAKISNNIGIILEQKGELLQAAEFYRDAAEVFEKIGERRSQGYSFGNLATNFLTRGLPFQARQYLDRASELFDSLGDCEASAMTAGNMADWFYLTGDLVSCEEYCAQALNLASDLGSSELKCETEIRLARLWMDRNRATALESLRKSNSDSVNMGWRELEVKAEYAICEGLVAGGEGGADDSLLERLDDLRKKNPPPEIACGIEIVLAILHRKEHDGERAIRSLMKAYRIATRSDLAYDRLKILHLYGIWKRGSTEAVEKRRRILEKRVFEGLDDMTVASMIRSLGDWVETVEAAAAGKTQKRSYELIPLKS